MTEKPTLYMILARSERLIVEAVMRAIGGRPSFDREGSVVIDLHPDVKLLNCGEFTVSEELDPMVCLWQITIITAGLCAPNPFVDVKWKFTRRILANDFTAPDRGTVRAMRDREQAVKA